MTAVRSRSAEIGLALALAALILLVLVASAPVAAVPDLRVRTAVLTFAGGVWLIAIALVRAGAGELRWIVAGAIALRLVAFGGAVRFSDDVYRYVWEGEVVLAAKSPYAFAPDAPELAELRARSPELAERVAHPSVPAAYPPLAQGVGAAACAVAHAFGGAPQTLGRDLLRALFAACDLAVIWPLVILLRSRGLAPALAVVWAWNPLLALEFAGSGHLDALAIACFVGALALLVAARPRRVESGFALLGAAILVKYVPAVAIPFVARDRRRALAAFVMIAGVLLAFTPFWALDGGGRGVASGLREYALRWESSSLVHRWIEAAFARSFDRDLTWTDPRRLARGVELAVWLAVCAYAALRVRDPLAAVRLAIGAYLILSPTLHPWYLAWVAPFVALRPTLAWCWLLAVIPLAYWPLEHWQTSGMWEEPAWLWPAVALPFFALLARDAFVAARKRRAR